MEKPMNKIPEIDSIAELARFWDVHDLTEFEDDLEEVVEPVFDHVEQMVLHIRLQPEQAAALHRIAESRGVKDADLLEEWVSEKLRVS
jgi:tRNA(Phe) wybutosine-synthesizing methylase Tyw3